MGDQEENSGWEKGRRLTVGESLGQGTREGEKEDGEGRVRRVWEGDQEGLQLKL